MSRIAKGIRAILSIVPDGIKDSLRSSARIRAVYLQCMGALGVFPGVPTPAETESLYARQSQCRNAILARLERNPIAARVALIIVGGPENGAAMQSTLASVSAQTLQPSMLLLWQQQSNDNQQLQTPSNKIDCPLSVVCGDSKAFLTALSKSIVEVGGCFFVRAGDRLKPDAIDTLSHYACDDLADIFYVDTDSADETGKLLQPRYYPAWNPDLQLSTGYARTGLWLSVSALQRHIPEIADDSELIALFFVRAYLQNRKFRVGHLPLVLVEQSEHSDFCFNRFEDGVNAALSDAGAATQAGQESRLIVQWAVAPEPLVSIIIPTRNAKALVKTCIDSIVEKTTYPNYEIILVSNNTDDTSCVEYFASLEQRGVVRLLHYDKPFNYSAINNFAVSHAKGGVLGFLNNDIEVISPDWLTYMVGHALRDDIGVVGAKLLYPDARIQHAGVVMGYGGGAGHAHKYYPHDHPGYLQRLASTNNYSAVTAACMLVEQGKFEATGGFNEANLAVAFNDVDLCLRFAQRGLKNVYCAEAVLCHHESISRGAEDTADKQRRFQSEVDYLKEQWQSYIQSDPAYHPALTLLNESFGLAEPDAINVSSLLRLR